MRTLIRFSIIVLFLVLGLQAVTAQTSPTRLRLKQLELAPDSTEHVITSDTNRVAVWTKMDSILFGTHTGSLTPGRIPRATGTYTLSDGVLRDDGTLLAIGGATVSGYSLYDYGTGAWRLATGTTAQRPGSPTAGAMRYNTTEGTWEYYGASAWEVPVKAATATGLFTSGSVLFADANGRATQDNTNLFFNDANNSLGVGTASPNSAARFHAYNNSNAASGIRIEQANAGNVAEAFFALYNDVGYAAAELFSSGFYDTGLRRQMLFATDANQTNGIGFATLTTAPINFRTNSNGSTNTRLSIAGAGTITASSPFVANSTATFPGTIIGSTSFIQSPTTHWKYDSDSGTDYYRYTLYDTHVGANNAYFDGANYKYHSTKEASLLQHSRLQLDFSTAASGTINTNITFATRLVSNSTGLGINTTPLYNFHISGTNAMMLSVGSTAQRPTGAAGLLRYNSSLSGIEFHNGSTWNTISSGFSGSGTTNYITKWTGTSSVGNSALTDDGTTLDYQVSSASDLLMRIWNTGAGTSKMRFVGSDNKSAKHQWTHTSGWTAAIDVSNSTANEDNAYMRFAVRGASDTNTEAGLTAATKMTILGSGNVGVGTTAPASRLDVEGGVSIGATYSGTTAAPTNGAIIEGLVGIGNNTPAFTLDMENATDAVDMPGGTTAQRPTNESELLRYNSDNVRMEYADGTNWRDVLPATSTTGAAILPSGSTAQRDGSPANGYIRYNTTSGQLEAYVQSAWANISASPRSYADMISSGAATYTESGTPHIIDTVTNIVAVGFTHSAGVLTYTGTTGKNFLVSISAVVGEDDTDAVTAVLRLYQNSTIKGVSQTYCALQDQKYSMNISRIVTLATSDTLDCRVASSGEWIVSNFYFNVTPID